MRASCFAETLPQTTTKELEGAESSAAAGRSRYETSVKDGVAERMVEDEMQSDLWVRILERRRDTRSALALP